MFHPTMDSDSPRHAPAPMLDRSAGRPTALQPRMEVIATLDRATADMAAGILIERSIPFAVDPRGDLSAILVDAEAAPDVKRLLIGSDPASSWQPRLAV